MIPSGKYGRVMMRGNEQFEVEAEPAFFTAVLGDDADEEKVRSLIAPLSIRKMGRRLVRIQVNPADRDAAMTRLRSKEAGLVCHHAYRLPGKEGTRYYLTDRLIVRLLPRAGDPRILFDAHGLMLQKKCKGISGTYVVQVTGQAGKNPLKVAHDLIQESGVVYAEPNLMERFILAGPVDTDGGHRQWHLDQISARQAWACTKGTREVVVAVVDDGCDLTHPAFAGDGKVVHPTDFVDGDARPWSDYPGVESGTHGTACAALAVAGENTGGVTGIAPGCAFMPVRMSAIERMEVETLNVRDMFELAGRYADVISCSWSNVPCYSPIPQPVADMFDKIATQGGPRGRGTVICFAAGNYNAPIRDDDNCHFEYKPRPDSVGSRVAKTKILNGFAAHPFVLTVAATTSVDQKARYSNWGKEISVCAPSDNYDPLSGQRLPGRELFTADNEAHGPGYVPGGRFAAFGGTSGACPIVAGVAGLVRSVQPRLRALQVKSILEETADPVAATGADAGSDAERIRAAYIAGHSAWFGYGRVNAQKAVEKALLFK
ncbi:MAG: hypothetical protein DSY90_05960 [Deltaproteobacteria bacterium]|nr:MAG: hypothetical protein DSY90_05960 [Deltaproteobacteria bacterium]